MEDLPVRPLRARLNTLASGSSARTSLVVVLLPDAGEIYLSKMYSDEWMRQNQFLGKSARVGDILQSKRRKLPELLSVEMTSSVRDAITYHEPIRRLATPRIR